MKGEAMKEYERLSQIRMERGYSVQDIAKVLGTTVTSVRRWESGKVKMRFSKYVILAKLYHVSLDYLAGLTDNLEI